jgi:hypothetical protein
VLAALLLASGAAACSSGEDQGGHPVLRDTQQAETRVASAKEFRRFGVRIVRPPAWHGGIYASRLTRLTPLVVVQLASFRVRRGDAARGFGFRPSERLRARDTRVFLFELPAEQVGTQGFRPMTPPLSVRDSDFERAHPALRAGRALARRRFALAGRPFSLFVEFGRSPPAESQLRTVRMLLRSFEVAPRPEANPRVWRKLRGPLRLPRVAARQRCPRARVAYAAPRVGATLGSGPAFPVLGSPEGIAALRDDLRQQGWYLHKTLWAVSAAYRGPVLVRGARIDARAPVFFMRHRQRELRFPPVPRGVEPVWRYFPSRTVLHAPGCYAFQIDGDSFTKIIVFEAKL